VTLRIGVVGLGRLWDARHKPALLRLRDRFRVVAVYDQVARRAAMEAEALGCRAAEGLTELVSRPDVDAVYLLSPQWFGFHAAELACEAGKPIYCALPAGADPAGLEALARSVRAAGVPFVPELARRFYPATWRLGELLATSLGPPRLIVGHVRLFGYDRYGAPGPSTQLAPLAMSVDPGANLLDWCRFLMRAEPSAIDGFGTAVLPALAKESDPASGEDFEGFVLKFPDGALAQMTIGRFHREAWDDAPRFLPPPGIQVYAERGVAWLEMPERIRWADRRGLHEDRLPLDPSVGEALNEHFRRRVRGEASLAPTLDDALAAARLVEALGRSRAEKRSIDPRTGP
jgi:predicted dehydrogenase